MTVVTSDNTALTYEANRVVTVNAVPPVAILQAPSKVGTDDDLKLDASGSEDPNKDPNGLSYLWSCKNVRIQCNCFINGPNKYEK